jgi:SNF2 family DNA or RNA helicase
VAASWLELKRTSQREITATLAGDANAVVAIRRRLSPHSSRQLPTVRGQESYVVPIGRLKAALVDMAPVLGSFGIDLRRDPFVEDALRSVGVEIGLLDKALSGDLSSPGKFRLSSHFRRKLTPRQREVVSYLLQLPHGANFSVPGAGKTSMLLALHDVLTFQGGVSGLLVVAPRNAFRPWEEELRTCLGSSLRVHRLTGGESSVRSLLATHGKSPKSQVFLVSYSQLVTAIEAIEDWLADHPNLHLVLDESHRIKRGPSGQWGRAVQRIAPYVRRRDILTGTPIPNATVDLAPQLNWLWPYREVIPDYQLRDEAAEGIVTEKLRPLYRRITKKELGLPPTRSIVHDVPMGPLQQRIYDAITDQARRATEHLQLHERSTLVAMSRRTIRLLQVASNPSLLAFSAEEFRLPPLHFDATDPLIPLLHQYNAHEIPAKFQFVVRRVMERSRKGLKTIVWSMFVRNLTMLTALLKAFEPVTIHGAIPTASESGEDAEGTREQLIERFKRDPKCTVLVANPAACGESISLHDVCHHAIYVDRSFNAAHYLQSRERIHRLGLPPNARVTYELLTSRDTVDSVVHQRLVTKTARLARLLDDPGLSAMVLDNDDPDPEEEFDEDDARAVMQFLLGVSD